MKLSSILRNNELIEEIDKLNYKILNLEAKKLNRENQKNAKNGHLKKLTETQLPSNQSKSDLAFTMVDLKINNIFGIPQDIIYSKDNSIHALSLKSMIQLLASSEPSYNIVFLTTFKSFCTPLELYYHLMELWERSRKLTLDEKNENDLKIFRFKFMNVFIMWLEKYPHDFDDSLISLIVYFIDESLQNNLISKITHEKISKIIKRVIEHKKESSLFIESQIIFEELKVDLSTINTFEISSQITLMDERYFKYISTFEFMKQAWVDEKTNQTNSPNILKMISRFNSVSMIMTRFIVSEPNLKKRKLNLVKVIKIAQKLRELHNYHSLMAVIASLESAPVNRLKRTWEIENIFQKQFQELKSIMSSEGSYKSFRQILKTEDPPAIPYIGVYLSDLTFIQDGNPDKIQDSSNNQLINFTKMKMLSSVIQDMMIYQQEPYIIEPIPRIQSILMNEESKLTTNSELFDLSLKSEPKINK